MKYQKRGGFLSNMVGPDLPAKENPLWAVNGRSAAMSRVAIAQMDIAHKDPERNRAKLEDLVAKALRYAPDLIVFPEMLTVGFTTEVFSEIMRYAEEESGVTLTLLQRLAKQHRLSIVSG